MRFLLATYKEMMDILVREFLMDILVREVEAENINSRSTVCRW